MVRKIAIILLGAPGSGKGTQGEILEEKIGFKRYVMSDLIKAELKPGTKLYGDVFKKGHLMNDGDIFSIFRKYFNSEKEIIIDGIPRTLDQAYWLYGFLVNHKYEIKLVFFDVDEKKLVNRITSRRYCPKCHRLYNNLTRKPKKIGFCDVDGEELIQREDDSKKVFRDRIKIFDSVKRIILDVYKGDVIRVKADGDIDKIANRLIKRILKIK